MKTYVIRTDTREIADTLDGVVRLSGLADGLIVVYSEGLPDVKAAVAKADAERTAQECIEKAEAETEQSRLIRAKEIAIAASKTDAVLVLDARLSAVAKKLLVLDPTKEG